MRDAVLVGRHSLSEYHLRLSRLSHHERRRGLQSRGSRRRSTRDPGCLDIGGQPKVVLGLSTLNLRHLHNHLNRFTFSEFVATEVV